MRNVKKVLFLVMALFATIALASCNSSNPVKVIVANNPVGDKLVYENNETDQVNVRGEYSYWRIYEDAKYELVETSSSNTTIHDSYTEEVLADGGIVRTYTYGETATDETLGATYQLYFKPETETTSEDIVLVVFRFNDTSNIIYNIGAEFNPIGIEAYAVQANGTIIELHNTLSENEFEALFSTDYETIVDDKYVSTSAFSVNFNYEGYATSFNAYVGAGDEPINIETANWFNIILVIPVAFIMQFFAGLFGNSFAVGIIITTFIIRTIAWPIYAKSNDMTMKMALAQPDLQRIQQKYATRKDPQSQQMMQMETMQIYKKYKINVFGCLMPFLQMPIFIAMFRVVRRITLEGGMYTEQVSNTNFLGIDLALGSQGIFSVSALLAVIVGGTMFLLQKISQKKPSYAKNTGAQNKNSQQAQTQQTMKMVSYFMVLMMASFAYSSNAMALYWIIGNAYSIGQTLINRRLNEKKHEQLKQKELLG